MKKLMKLPLFLKKYFWDVDFDKLDLSKRTEYIILKLLEYGDIEAVRWLFKNVSRTAIKKVILTQKGLSPKSGHFWSLLFDLNREEIPCLQKPYQKIRKKHWPY